MILNMTLSSQKSYARRDAITARIEMGTELFSGQLTSAAPGRGDHS
jgi:hypothetical protein